ncbi:MAG: YraN family protein [Burkholderiaceae bacterium]|nr:MAG: YraN family protein [Burkholderiaceae bacterium]
MLPRFIQKLKHLTTAQQVGQRGEDAALAYLEARGLRCVTRNYRCKGGEIDLIMQHRDSLVFVEVRARSRSDFGSAADSITAAKRKRVQHAAQHYLLRTQDMPACRFDVVTIDTGRVDWVQNAFDMPSE